MILIKSITEKLLNSLETMSAFIELIGNIKGNIKLMEYFKD